MKSFQTIITALLEAISRMPDKKLVALTHFIFNLITAAMAFLLLSILIKFISLI